jgi:hypothetical protein
MISEDKMADQFSKQVILDKLKAKVRAKGFELEPDRSKMAKGVVTILDMLDIIAESLADQLADESKSGTLKAKEIKLGPTGLQQPGAFKEAEIKFDNTTDPKFFNWMEQLHAIIRGSYPEPGYGSPNKFANALKRLLAQKPSSLTGKITVGSKSVKVTT